jgi:hypothetical protein
MSTFAGAWARLLGLGLSDLWLVELMSGRK